MPKTITYTNGLQNLSGSQLPDAIIRLAGKVLYPLASGPGYPSCGPSWASP